VAKQKIIWKDLEVEIELDEIEKRAPTAPCRLKRCDWPNVERTQSRHEKLAASVIGKTRQDSFMLQTCRVLATLYTDPFLGVVPEERAAVAAKLAQALNLVILVVTGLMG